MKKSTDTLPPHSEECEIGLLSCALQRPDLLDEISVKESDLYGERHKIIFRSLLNLRANKCPIDLITVHQFLKDQKLLQQCGGITYLSKLQDAAPSAGNWTVYHQTVLDKSELRK